MLPAPPLAMAAREGGTPGGLFPNIQDVPIHIRGSYARLGPLVPRRLPRFLAGDHQQPIEQGASGRMELARWIASAENPLTARVIVNRIWQHHFGAGLVRTPSNFGKLGEPPTHAALLDWLAAELVADGWSLKQLHRQIVLSAAYQQSSIGARDALRTDPDNRRLARFAPRRLEAEAIRDTLLLVAGQLDTQRGGPAADDVMTRRRSLYVQTARWDRSNIATLFDAANPDASVEQRAVTTVSPQALFLLNHPFSSDMARHFAARLRAQSESDAGRIELAYRLLYGRPPLAKELEIGQAFLARAANLGADAAWVDYAHLLLCTNEMIYVD
jgi:hypothetical protein